MASPQAFRITKCRSTNDNRQRLGSLEIRNRVTIQTPNLLAIASRGFVPHLTPDLLQNETSIQAVHAGFEDFAESIPDAPAHYAIPCTPTESPLRNYTSLPNTSLLVLGPRRGKPIDSNGPNSYTSLNVCTSVGHRELEISYYLQAIQHSRPDVIIAPVDIEFGRHAPGLKRQDKIVERSTAWIRSFEAAIKEARASRQIAPLAWVPLLALDGDVQRTYLQHLEEHGDSFIDGIVMYSPRNVMDIPLTLQALPVVGMTNPQSPHDILRLVQLGVDLVTVPFITAASEAGIALDFLFPPQQTRPTKPLGLDLWLDAHATDLSSLVKDCSCYACCNHHRAYVRHLLSAKEMLAWTLLQIHNHHVVSRFFAGIRQSLADGTFDRQVEEFTIAYEPELPAFQGQGPRLRGYQASFGANPIKLNKSPFKKMGKEASTRGTSTERISGERKGIKLESKEAGLLSPEVDSAILEDLGFAQLYDKDELHDDEE